MVTISAGQGEEGWVVGLVWGNCFPLYSERIGTRLSYMYVFGNVCNIIECGYLNWNITSLRVYVL